MTNQQQNNNTNYHHYDAYNNNNNRTIIVFTSPYNIQCGIVLRALQTRHIGCKEISISTSANHVVRESGGFEQFMKDYFKVTNGSYSVPKICIYYHNNNVSSNRNNNNKIHMIHGVDDILQEIRRIDFSSNYNVVPFERYKCDVNEYENENDENEKDDDDSENDDADDEVDNNENNNFDIEENDNNKFDHDFFNDKDNSNIESNINDIDNNENNEKDNKGDIVINENDNNNNKDDVKKDIHSDMHDNNKDDDNDFFNSIFNEVHNKNTNNVVVDDNNINHQETIKICEQEETITIIRERCLILDRWLLLLSLQKTLSSLSSLISDKQQNNKEKKLKKSNTNNNKHQEEKVLLIVLDEKSKKNMNQEEVLIILEDNKSGTNSSRSNMNKEEKETTTNKDEKEDDSDDEDDDEDDEEEEDDDDDDDMNEIEYQYNVNNIFSCIPDIMIELYDGYTIPYCILMEELKNHLRIIDVRDTMFSYTYKNMFTGYDLEQCFVDHIIPHMIKKYNMMIEPPSSRNKVIYKEQMNTIGEYLVESNVIRFTTKYNNMKSFMGDMNTYIRLQCYHIPKTINSYHSKDHMKYIENHNINPLQFVRYIYEQLYYIQYDSINDYTLLIDYNKCYNHTLFNKLEHTICQFHTLSLDHLNRIEMITFTLNIIDIMRIYTFIKIGIPLTEIDQIHFYQNMKLMTNNYITFSMRDWIDGILRCNQPSGMNHYQLPPFPINDRRHEYLINVRGEQSILFNPQIHLALQMIYLPNSVPFYQYETKYLNYQLMISSHTFFEEKNHLFHMENHNNNITKKTTIQLNYMIGKVYRNDFLHHNNKGYINKRSNNNKNQNSPHDLLLSLKEYMPQCIQNLISISNRDDKKPESPSSITDENRINNSNKSGSIQYDMKYTVGHWNRYASNYQVYTPKSIITDDFNVSQFRRIRCQYASKGTRYERQRLESLRQLNVITYNDDMMKSSSLYNDHTEFCDDITKSIQDELIMPIVMISFIDNNRQWIHTQQNSIDQQKLNTSKLQKQNQKQLKQQRQQQQNSDNNTSFLLNNEHCIPRDISMCGHTIMLQNIDIGYDYSDIMTVNDTLLDDRFADHPYIQTNHIRFYAGIPIAVPNLKNMNQKNGNVEKSYNVGTLCVQDIMPRSLTDHNKRILKQYAKHIQIELIRRAIELKTQEQPKINKKNKNTNSLYQSINTNVK